jgi:hypothetical protein
MARGNSAASRVGYFMIVGETMRFQDEPHPADPGYEPESATLPEAGERFDRHRHLPDQVPD